MQFNRLLAMFLTLALAIAGQNDPAAKMRTLADGYRQNMLDLVDKSNSSCTRKNLSIRKEWENLQKSEKLNYISAVQCLLTKPTKTGGLAHNRYEDFVMAHVNQTLFIHNSGLLLPWHRRYIVLFETALREECGYTGYLPYWDWSKYVQNNGSATIFDGSGTSLSGNGKYIEHGNSSFTIPGGHPPRPTVVRPAGTGGGCVHNGPFKDLSPHIGPVNTSGDEPIQVHIHDESRCLKRDFILSTLAQTNSYQNVTDLIDNNPSIHTFHPALEAGVHPFGHLFIGGEEDDLFASPNDPVFFQHHGMVDRVWAIWQGLDYANRRDALDGPLTMLNDPASPNATAGSLMNFGSLVLPSKIGTVMSTVDDGLCYIYE